MIHQRGDSTGEGVLRACLASPIFAPEYSGAALRFQRYAPGLRARGVVLQVLAAEPGAWRRDGARQGAGGGSLPAVDPELQIDRVSVPSGTPLWRTRWVYESAVLERCRVPSSSPDLIIWLSLSSKSLPVLWRLRRAGVPMLYVQTMMPEGVGRGWRSRLTARYRTLRHRLVDYVVVSSGVMEARLRRLGVTTPMEAIPHGVDLARFRPAANTEEEWALRARLGVGSEAELILFVGSLSRRKGLEHLVPAWTEVAARRPEAHLLLLGPARLSAAEDDSFAREVRVALKDGVGGQRVHFLGSVQDVAPYMRAADLFVLPSLREGMPNVVGEAFGCALASILTPFEGLPEEFGRPGREYVLVEHDASALARSMDELLANPERRRELGAAARRWCSQNLDVERSLDRWADVCRRMTQGRPRAQGARPELFKSPPEFNPIVTRRRS